MVNWLEQYNVVWITQSKNFGESMSVSGDIGLNAWLKAEIDWLTF